MTIARLPGMPAPPAPDVMTPLVVVGGVIYGSPRGGVPALNNGLPYGLIGSPSSNPTSTSPNPAQLKFQFDTIGQIIPRSIGHGRLPLKFIWVQGQDGTDVSQTITFPGGMALAAPAGAADTTISVNATPDWLGGAISGVPLLTYYAGGGMVQTNQLTGVTGTTITLGQPIGLDLPAGTSIPVYAANGSGAAPTITFAAALCNPIDPLELGNITEVWDSANQVYSLDDGGLTLPSGWNSIQQQQLAAALASAVVYPGTEGQLPSALIVADRGAGVVPAFRGLRYIVVQAYPLVGNASTLRLSVTWRRSNPIRRMPPPAKNVTAVQFGPGSS